MEYVCNICDKEFGNSQALNGHKNIHGKRENILKKFEAIKYLNNERHEQNTIKYNKNPRKCNFCKEPLNYKRRANKFCSHYCSARYNNSKRDKNFTSRLKPAKCIKCDEDILIKIGCSLEKAMCSPCKSKIIKKRYKQKGEKSVRCNNCNNTFTIPKYSYKKKMFRKL